MQSHFCFGCGHIKPEWGFPQELRFVGGIVPFHIGCEHTIASPGGERWSVLYEPIGRPGRVFAERVGRVDFEPVALHDIVTSLLEMRATRIELVRHYTGKKAARACPTAEMAGAL